MIICHCAILHYHMSFKTIAWMSGGVFWWFPALSEDQEKTCWIHQNYLAALTHFRYCTTPRLFSHDSKVRNLKFNSKCAFEWLFKWRYFGPCVRQNHIAMRNLKCAIQMIIQMTVFWTVCTPNHIAILNLNCAFQIMHRDVIWHTHGPKYSLSNFN